MITKRLDVDEHGNPLVRQGGRWYPAVIDACKWCGKDFPHRLRKESNEGQYCSSSHAVKGQHANNPARKMVKKCPVCKRIFVILKSQDYKYASCFRPYCRKRHRQNMGRRVGRLYKIQVYPQ